MILLTILVALTAAILFLPTLSDLLSLLKVVVRPARSRGAPPASLPRFLVVVPAHNEELLIGSCVRSLLGMDYPADHRRVVVVADNCTDRTAALVREAGAECLERHDLENRGKPHALAWAFGQLPLEEYDAVLIVDADTLVEPAFARTLARHAPLADRAIQGVHGVRNADDSPMTLMAAVLATALYRFMYPLRSKAGLSVPLTGNGMCIGTAILRERGWRAFSIAEDTELYVDLTRGGYRVEVEPDAIVRSQAARELKQSEAQRTRWRAGRLAILRRLGPEVLFGRGLGVHQRLDMLGELLLPGPLVHLGLVVILWKLLAIARPPAAWVLVGVLALPILRMVIYTALAIPRQPAPGRTMKAFLYLPVYLVWRMATELKALNMDGDSGWVRTDRHEAGEDESGEAPLVGTAPGGPIPLRPEPGIPPLEGHRGPPPADPPGPG